MGKVSFGEINVAVRRGGKTAQLLHTARDRIAELEAALRKIAAGETDEGGNRRNHPNATIIARKALNI